MSPERLVFDNPEPLDHESAEAVFATNDGVAISRALVGAALGDPDGDWIEIQCLRLAQHPDVAVRGLAGLCLGHVARRFGQVSQEAWRVVRELCADPTVDNRPCDGLDDMRQFAGPEPEDR